MTEKELNYLKYVGGERFQEETDHGFRRIRTVQELTELCKNTSDVLAHIKRKILEELGHMINIDK
jgi:hypothetical protein